MGPDSTVAYVELISTNRFFHPSGVHVAPERSHEELGVSALGMAGYLDWEWVAQIDKIQAGWRWVGLIRVDPTGFWKVLWGYVTWDWERKARDVPVKWHFQDQYGRDWPPVSAPVRIEYEMPMNLAVLYYMMVLLVCTVLGNAMRWFVGQVPSRGSEVGHGCIPGRLQDCFVRWDSSCNLKSNRSECSKSGSRISGGSF